MSDFHVYKIAGDQGPNLRRYQSSYRNSRAFTFKVSVLLFIVLIQRRHTNTAAIMRKTKSGGRNAHSNSSKNKNMPHEDVHVQEFFDMISPSMV